MPDDYAGNDTTTGSITLGGTATGTLEVAGDTDWFAIELSAGDFVNVSLDGNSLGDPLLTIYDSAGNIVASDDDGGPGLDSQTTFTATQTATYYIQAAGYGSSSGSYQVSASAATPTTYNPLDSLTWGTQLSDNNIEVYFGTSGFTADGMTSEGFNAFERAQFQAVFDLIASVIDVTFSIVDTASTAGFRLVLDTNEFNNNNALGYFYPQGFGSLSGTGVFNGAAWDRTAGGDLDRGGYSFNTIVHEVLHGLGMSHPHDTGGSSDVLPGVSGPFDSYGQDLLNQGVFTSMSYNSGYHVGGVGTTGQTFASGGAWGHGAGPMALDIAVLQSLYGANTSTAAGANTYTLPSSNGAGVMWESIWDTGGIDTIIASGSRNAVIDLRAATLEGAIGGGGYLSATQDVAGGFTIAAGVVIENATGSISNDTITGNDANNVLIGHSGNDSITGGQGHDWAEGDGGHDTLVGGQGNDSLLGRSGDDLIMGDDGSDQIAGAEGSDTIYGGAGNDTMGGGSGADRLYGGDGDDFGGAGFGNDYIEAGEGNDLFSAGWGMDTVYGGDGNDWLAGSYDTDYVEGGLGNDTIGGGTGNDTILGGAGHDQIGAGDDNDFIRGGVGNDFLGGGDGNDQIFGDAGQDTLNGGHGNDTLSGGADADLFIFNAISASGNSTITDFEDGQDILRLVGLALPSSDPLSGLNITDVSGGVMLTYGAHTITLQDVAEADLSEADFLFT